VLFAIALRVRKLLGYYRRPSRLQSSTKAGNWHVGFLTLTTTDNTPVDGDVPMKKLIILGLVVTLAGCAKKAAQHEGKSSEQWAEGLRSTAPNVRGESARALGALKATKFVPELIAALKDGDEEVRSRAAEAIWSIGKDARQAVTDLVPLLKDRNATTRLNAVGALGELGPEAAPAVPALRDRLKDPDTYVRAQAATALGKIRPPVAEAVPALISATKDRSKEVRVAALYALAEFGPEAQSARPALNEAAKSRDADVKVAAVYALKTVDGKK
jgi:HEAT repeat protein